MIEAIHDRIIVKRIPPEEVTKGGIVIPEVAKKRQERGEVKFLGKGKPLANGNYHPPSVKKGDIVLFSNSSSVDIKVNNEDLVAMTEDDILAVLEE